MLPFYNLFFDLSVQLQLKAAMQERTIQPDTRLQLRRLAPVLPYAAVIVGLYFFDSAWAAIALYHLGMIVVLSVNRCWRLGPLPQSSKDYLLLVAVVFGSSLGGLFLYFMWGVD